MEESYVLKRPSVNPAGTPVSALQIDEGEAGAAELVQ